MGKRVTVELRPGQEVKVCEWCATAFVGRSDAKYCSDKCKVNAWREKKREEKTKPAK